MRGPHPFLPAENRPTAHRARASRSAGLLAWLCCGPTRCALLPTPSAGARSHQHRGRLAARALGGRGHCARPNSVAHGPRSYRPVDYRPTAHRARALRNADLLAWLWCGPTRGAFLAVALTWCVTTTSRKRKKKKIIIICIKIKYTRNRPARCWLWTPAV